MQCASFRRRQPYGTYDYGYTATLTDDIHVDKERLPDVLKEILADFRNHVFVPCSQEEVPENLLDFMEDGYKVANETLDVMQKMYVH